MKDNSTIIDNDTTLAIGDGDNDFLKEIIDLFLDDSQKLLTKIENAIQSENSDELRRFAHSLKGSAGHFGASRLFNTAYKMEIMGKMKEFSDAQEFFPYVKKETDKAREALMEFISNNI